MVGDGSFSPEQEVEGVPTPHDKELKIAIKRATESPGFKALGAMKRAVAEDWLALSDPRSGHPNLEGDVVRNSGFGMNPEFSKDQMAVGELFAQLGIRNASLARLPEIAEKEPVNISLSGHYDNLFSLTGQPEQVTFARLLDSEDELLGLLMRTKFPGVTLVARGPGLSGEDGGIKFSVVISTRF